MEKIAFYIMNIKGYYVLQNFIEEYSPKSIEYIICSSDSNLAKDYYEEIVSLAKKHNIKIFNRIEDYTTVEDKFKGFKFAIGWRWLITDEKKLIVIHDSLLPKYRGFAPLVNSLINGENTIGATALFANDEYDKGDILMQKNCKITYPIKIAEAIQKIQPLYYELVSEIYKLIKNKSPLNSVVQDENKASYSLWLDEEDYFINWKWSAEKIKRFIDAVGRPYAGACTYINKELVRIYDVEILKEVNIEHRDRHIGKVIFMHNKCPVIICGEGILLINDFKSSDGKQGTINFRTRFKSGGYCDSL